MSQISFSLVIMIALLLGITVNTTLDEKVRTALCA